VIGIVTLEDIIEDIIQDEIEDEFQKHGEFDQRKLFKDKLVLLFSDHQANKILSEAEIKAALDFLEKYVKPF
jgi:CBS domain containing-hemolysin-like protein